jgi:hypothetical protein
MDGRRGQSQTSQVQPSEKKKWRYACRLFETNRLQEGAKWHVYTLLGNYLEISEYKTAVDR